jgi:hypothetical protein
VLIAAVEAVFFAVTLILGQDGLATCSAFVHFNHTIGVFVATVGAVGLSIALVVGGEEFIAANAGENSVVTSVVFVTAIRAVWGTVALKAGGDVLALASAAKPLAALFIFSVHAVRFTVTDDVFGHYAQVAALERVTRRVAAGERIGDAPFASGVSQDAAGGQQVTLKEALLCL